VFGQALAHAEASLNFLELLDDWMLQATEGLLEGLARGPACFPALLSLRCSTGGAQSFSALVTGGRVPSLRDLKVNLSGIGQAEMQTFSAALTSPHVIAPRLLEISFGGVETANAAAEVGMFSVALSSGHLRRLQSLHVRGLRVIEEVHALCVGLGSGGLSSLRTLDLFYNRLGVQGGMALSEVLVAEKLPSLRKLDVRHTEFTDEGVGALTETWMNRRPPPLRELDFFQNQLTSAVLDSLFRVLQSHRMPSLEIVDFRRNPAIHLDERMRRLLSDMLPTTVLM